MHLIYVSRLFTGLFETISTGQWNPTGVPTVVKFLETAARQMRITWVVVCKNLDESAIIQNRPRIITINNIIFHLIPFRQYVASYRLNTLLNDFAAYRYCSKLSRRSGTKLFYVDSSNIVLAAMLKRLVHAKIVVRILGLKAFHKSLVSDQRYRRQFLLRYLAYKTRYDLVICSQDGSGAEFYLDKLLNSKTNRKILLNGIQKKEVQLPLRQTATINLLFVGKLTAGKGVLELLDAAAAFKKHVPDFLLKIVGKGELRGQIDNIIDRDGLSQNVQLLDAVSLATIHRLYEETDIYISLNKLGNLSNTVLEAMAAGKCVIMLDKDLNAHIDEYTDTFVPHDAVMRIDRNTIVTSLTAALLELCMNRQLIESYEKKIKIFAENALWTWEQRMQHEIELISKIFSTT